MWATVSEAWDNYSPYTEAFTNVETFQTNDTTIKPASITVGNETFETTQSVKTEENNETERENDEEPDNEEKPDNQKENNNVPQPTTSTILNAIENNNNSINSILKSFNDKIDRELKNMNDTINTSLKQNESQQVDFFNKNIHDILLFVIFGIFVILLLDSTYRLISQQVKKNRV